MSDLISRQAVLDILSGKNAAWDAYKKVAELPSAERPKGKWLRTPTSWIYCSVCDNEPPNESNYASKYCPNCGAEMEMEE